MAKKPVKASKMSDAKRRRLAEALPLRKYSLEPKLEPMDGITEDTDLGKITSHAPVKLKKSDIEQRQEDRIKREEMEAKEREKGAIAERKHLKALNLNLDRQCGVINSKLIPCPRSLTCKSHNVGAKLAVEGRSRPYDELYLTWQREHNPNFKEPGRKSVFTTRGGGGVGGSTSTAAGGKNPKKRKRAEGFGDGEADTEGEEEWRGAEGVLGDAVMDGEEGLLEMEDLVRVTRVAEERVRRTIDALGINSAPTITPNDTLPEHMHSAVDRHRHKEYHQERRVIPVRELMPAPLGGKKTAVVSPGKAFQPVWRTSGGAFSDVGKMLVQALAARPAGAGVGGRGGGGAGAGGFGHDGQRQGSMGQRQSVPV